MPPPVIQQRVRCPSCDQKGKKVSTTTLAALLSDEFAGEFRSSVDRECESAGCRPIDGDTGWRFCGSQSCDVVYFAEDGHGVFEQPQLKVAVGVKQTSGDRPLCYCFGHSIASIKQELAATGSSNVLEDIRAKMKDPGCRCETENPSGSCCLGNVAKGIEIAKTELGMGGSAEATIVPPRSSRGEKIAKAGTLLSAIAASSCCWLPLLLLAVGVSGAGIASALEAYRPLFMTITFGFLGAAFYFTYRPKNSAASTSSDCCPTSTGQGDDCCAPPKHRLSVMAMNKVMLWVVTVLAVVFLLFPTYVGAFVGNNETGTFTADMHKTIMKVDGMSCEGCAALVAEAIRSSPEVLAVDVSYEKGEAIVGTADDTDFPAEQIILSLKDAGFACEIQDDD